MDPNHPNNFPNSQNLPHYPNSEDYTNFASYMSTPHFLSNSQDQPNSQFYQNTQFPPHMSQIPTSQEISSSENISQNLFEGVQCPNKNKKGAKNVTYCVKEDLALMSSWLKFSEDSVRGKNQKGESFWARVHKSYHQSQAKNPTELNERNIESMKGRWKRLSENASKWVAACRQANARRRSGMSDKDVENEAHSIYERDARGHKFQDLIVFNEVMCKHPKWNPNDISYIPQSEDVDDQESGGSSKRSKTSENGEFFVPSNPETPTSRNSTISRPIGRDKAKRKGKGKASQSESESANEVFAAEVRAMRISRDNETELMKSRIELEREKLQRNAMKMKEKMLMRLMEKDHLTPEDEEMKRRLIEIVFGQ